MVMFVPPVALALSTTTNWSQRIRRGKYESPKGSTVEFDCEQVSRKIPLRRTPFNFPGINDSYVQDNGFSARVYPIRCFFSGPAHDKHATAFESALIEPGSGVLHHPFYGRFNVIPTGTIERREDLVNELNQSIVEVEFMTTTGAVYPSKQTNPKNEIEEALARLAFVTERSFASKVSVGTTIQRANLKARVRELLKNVSAYQQSLSDHGNTLTREFRDAERLVNESLDVLVGEPLLLARQTINLITMPARATSGLLDRIDGYAAFARDLMRRSANLGTAFVPGLDDTSFARTRSSVRIRNDFQATDMFVAAALAGAGRAALGGAYKAKPEALTAALTVATLLEDIDAWRAPILDNADLVDDGDTYAAMFDLVGSVSGYLVEASFVLVPERIITLDRARTFIDLCAELYGSVSDERLNFLINTNNLSGSELLELPRGRRIAYYA